MKVTDIKCFVVDCFRTNWVFVKVYTDERIDGVGEATLEYKEKALLGAVEHIKEYLVGQNPLDIEKHWHAIYRDAYWRGGPVLMSALSAVEMALWDILGKSLNVPVYQLMGGKVNDKVRIYVNGWFAGAKEPEEFGEKAKIAVERGVTAMKWDPFGKSYLEISNHDLDKALRNVAAVREAVGDNVDLLIEGHGRFNIPMLKYNQLQLYMESFVYEYKNFPEYVKDSQPLTSEDIRELDKYCKERFIKLVPNQNSFGHMASWTKKEEISRLAITKDGKPSATLNPFLDGTLELIDKIYDGIFDDFSADMLNIGMDEPFELGLGETKEMCDEHGVGKVYTDYLVKVCELAHNKYGVVPMFWDDIVFKHPEQLDNIPDYAIVMEWGYETEQHFDRNCRILQEKNLRYYVCPGTSMWGSYTGRTNNAVLNIGMAAETGAYYGAEGFLLTEWGDGGHPQFPSTAMFPLVYGGAVSWNCMDHNHETNYEQRRLLIKDCIKFADKYIYNSVGETSLCDIVYRMGNYYLLEDLLQFNRTEIWCYTRENHILTDENKKAFSKVKKYMTELKEEIKKVKADENAVREIECNCDMVILFAGILSGEKGDYTKYAEKIIFEYETLWDMKNKSVGKDGFTKFVNNFVNDFDK